MWEAGDYIAITFGDAEKPVDSGTYRVGLTSDNLSNLNTIGGEPTDVDFDASDWSDTTTGPNFGNNTLSYSPWITNNMCYDAMFVYPSDPLRTGKFTSVPDGNYKLILGGSRNSARDGSRATVHTISIGTVTGSSSQTIDYGDPPSGTTCAYAEFLVSPDEGEIAFTVAAAPGASFGYCGAAILILLPGSNTGNLSVTEANDTVSSAGSLSVAGLLSATEASDSLSSAGAISISALASIAEATDTVSSTGALSVSGSSSISEDADTVSSGATLSIDASASVTEQADALSASGTVAAPGSITGELAVTEQSDTVSSAGALSIVASSAISEAADSVSATGTLSTGGVASITEANDQLSSAVVLSIVGALTKTEANDTLRSTNVEPTPTDNVYTIQVMTPKNAVSIQSTVKTIKARRI